jgi:hypothetical protein
LNAFKSPTQVEISLYTEVVSIYFKQIGRRGIKSGHCTLSTVCERFDWKLSFVTQVSSQLFLLLKSVGTLRVVDSHVSYQLSLLLKIVGTLRVIDSQDDGIPGWEDVDSTQWLEVFLPFTHVGELRVSGQLVPGIVQALV